MSSLSLILVFFIWPVISYGIAILSNANNDQVKYLSPPLALISHPTRPGRRHNSSRWTRAAAATPSMPRCRPSPAPRLDPLLLPSHLLPLHSYLLRPRTCHTESVGIHVVDLGDCFNLCRNFSIYIMDCFVSCRIQS